MRSQVAVFLSLLHHTNAERMKFFLSTAGLVFLFVTVSASAVSLHNSELFYQNFAGQSSSDQTKVACIIEGDVQVSPSHIHFLILYPCSHLKKTTTLLEQHPDVSLVVWSELSDFSTDLEVSPEESGHLDATDVTGSSASRP